MYTSDIDRSKNSRSAVAFLAASAFCGFFSSVYFRYSHGVSSDYMVFLSAVPFVLGTLPYLLLYLLRLRAPKRPIGQIYNCGVATLTTGFCLAGIFEIYGSECAYVPIYFCIGTVLVAAAFVWYLLTLLKK